MSFLIFRIAHLSIKVKHSSVTLFLCHLGIVKSIPCAKYNKRLHDFIQDLLMNVYVLDFESKSEW